MAMLTVRYANNPEDDVGRLWFDVQTSSFTRRSYFWSDLSEMKSIGEELQTYPLQEPLHRKWGFNGMIGRDVVLALCIEPVDAAGRLQARVELADLHDTERRLCAKFFTEYPALDELRLGLAALARDRVGEAMLSGWED